jgi:hypothetical protein
LGQTTARAALGFEASRRTAMSAELRQYRIVHSPHTRSSTTNVPTCLAWCSRSSTLAASRRMASSSSKTSTT